MKLMSLHNAHDHTMYIHGNSKYSTGVCTVAYISFPLTTVLSDNYSLARLLVRHIMK